MEAIVLAGGRGTRLQVAVPDLPKPLAPIADRPFLAYLLDLLAQQGIGRTILSVGYMGDAIVETIGARHGDMEIGYCAESKPLGTGGAVRRALDQVNGSSAFVVNGDTFFSIDFRQMWARHREETATLTMALKHMPDTTRYGRVESDAGHVTRFREKGVSGPGLINGGIYLMETSIFDHCRLPESFSFEQDFLLPNLAALKPVAFASDAYFIDIGIPEDYLRAGMELPQLPR
jgi:D-glycero-alpha-D-manno-heptose 1-phosphate guanylyltransferase